MSSLVLLLVVVDRSPAKDPRRAFSGRPGVLTRTVHAFPGLCQVPVWGSEATLKSGISEWRIWDMKYWGWKIFGSAPHFALRNLKKVCARTGQRPSPGLLPA